MTEALSDMISLEGELARSILEVAAKLGWREAGTIGVNIEDTDEAVGLPAGGISVFGVGMSRSVFGVGRADIGD